MDRGTWWATVHGVAKESDTTEQLHFLSFFTTRATWETLPHLTAAAALIHDLHVSR